ncbi:MAG TPA: glycerophosphodiester phosphodiesterase family protein, partial [Tissierellaceae bacterium]|nr:glycerophosphodiester phosphodiesterase family protein [Tissierellaceae bacterium]
MRKLVLLALLMLLLPITTAPSAKADDILSGLALTDTELELTEGERFNININNKVKGSTYFWYTWDWDVVEVNPKNGYVTALKEGEAEIRCRVNYKGITKILKCLVKVEKPEFFKHGYMAHAGGGYEGNIYSNTEEAIRNSIDNGYKFIEVDMTLTSDDKLVVSHGWNKNTCEATGIEYTDGKAPTYNEFMSWKIHGKYDTIDASTVIEIMKEYPDLLVEVDLKKHRARRTKIMIEQLVELADYDEQILDRILMQFTSEEAFFAIEEVYSFKYYQYFTYKSRIKDELEDVIDFCKENKITSVAVNYNVLTDEMINRIKEENFYLLAFTID